MHVHVHWAGTRLHAVVVHFGLVHASRVRQVERLIQRMTESREPKNAEDVSQDPNIKAAVEELERVLGTRVRVVPRSEERGRLEIEYFSQEDLARIYELIVGEPT